MSWRSGQRYTEALGDLEGLGTRMNHEPDAERLLAHLRVISAWRRTTFLKLASLVMGTSLLFTPGPPATRCWRWPVTSTTERANPLRLRNPGWGGCSSARRPVAAVGNSARGIRHSSTTSRTRCQPGLRLGYPRHTGSTAGLHGLGAGTRHVVTPRERGAMARTEVRTRQGMAVTVALTAATIGVVYGYDTGSIAGALLFVPKQFNLSTTATEWIATFTGLGLILGALLANRIADRFGRKVAMMSIAIGFTVFAILQGAAQDIVWIDITRFFLGVFIGISTVAAPVFIAESAPVNIRGALIVGYQVATVVGIMVAYFADYALAGSGSWRIMLGLSAIASAGVLIVLVRLPDTPRWYLMRGRREDALR